MQFIKSEGGMYRELVLEFPYLDHYFYNIVDHSKNPIEGVRYITYGFITDDERMIALGIDKMLSALQGGNATALVRRPVTIEHSTDTGRFKVSCRLAILRD